MAQYKVILHYPDGETSEEDELFDSEEEAFEHGEYLCGCLAQGNEDLFMMNPGDYPLDDEEDIEIEVIEAH